MFPQLPPLNTTIQFSNRHVGLTFECKCMLCNSVLCRTLCSWVLIHINAGTTGRSPQLRTCTRCRLSDYTIHTPAEQEERLLSHAVVLLQYSVYWREVTGLEEPYLRLGGRMRPVDNISHSLAHTKACQSLRRVCEATDNVIQRNTVDVLCAHDRQSVLKVRHRPSW